MKVNNSIFSVIFLVVSNIANAVVEIPTVFINGSENSNNSSGFYVSASEITNAAYAEFLNEVAATDVYSLYNVGMGFLYGGIARSGSSGNYTYTATKPNLPVNYVSFWDAVRFANWLTTGNTETGVYELTPDNIANNTVTRNQTVWENGGVVIASLETELLNLSNLDLNQLGILNQIPNDWEWDDVSVSLNRGLRDNTFTLDGNSFIDFDPILEDSRVGFRISSLDSNTLVVPEPSTYTVIFGCVGLAVVLTCRRKGNKIL